MLVAGCLSLSPHLSPDHAAPAGGGSQAELLGCAGQSCSASCDHGLGQPGSVLPAFPSCHMRHKDRVQIPAIKAGWVQCPAPCSTLSSGNHGPSAAALKDLGTPQPTALLPVPLLPTAFLTTVPPTRSGDAQRAWGCSRSLPPLWSQSPSHSAPIFPVLPHLLCCLESGIASW